MKPNNVWTIGSLIYAVAVWVFVASMGIFVMINANAFVGAIILIFSCIVFPGWMILFYVRQRLNKQEQTKR